MFQFFWRFLGFEAKCIALIVFQSSLLACLPCAARSEALTLEQAVQLAMERAPQLQAPQAALESANAQAIAAGRLPDPELVVGIDNLPINTDDAWSLTSDFMTMRKIGIMQDVPNSQKRRTQRGRATAQIHLAQAQKNEAALLVAQAAADAWVETVTMQRLIGFLDGLKSELQLQADAATGSLRAGRASTLDALTAQDALLEIEDRLVEARREVRLARVALTRWIGEVAQTFEPAGQPDFKTLTVEQQRSLAALHQHAALVAFDARIEVARSEVALARAEKRPDWGAGLSYAKRGDAFSDMISLEFRIGLPLFSATRQDPQIRARQAEVSKLEAEREADLRMHTEEIAQVLARWESARERVELFERERLPLAQERRRAAIASYQAGGASLPAVLASVRQEIELHEQHAQLQRELGRTWVFLRYLQPGVTP